MIVEHDTCAHCDRPITYRRDDNGGVVRCSVTHVDPFDMTTCGAHTAWSLRTIKM